MAMTGAVFGDRCFTTPGDAVDAYYSSSAPALTMGTTSYLNEFMKESGIWRAKSWSVSSTGAATLRYNVAAPIPTFAACDPEINFFDGMAIGWSISLALVLVASYKMMKRAAS